MSTQVTPSPELHFQFFDANGNPLSGGFLYSYAAGTSTLLNTFADSTGTVLNTNPILLDGTGSPSNGSVQTGIWLLNSGYKFVAYDANMVQQWSVDNVVGALGLLNLANTWTFPQTFTQPITITATDNQIVTGAVGNQTTLEYVPPVGNVVLSFPNTTDTMVARNTTDTLTNKTLTSPILNTPTINFGTFNAPGIIALKQFSVVTITGDTNPHTVYAINVGALGPFQHMRITVAMRYSNVAGDPLVKINYGGADISNGLPTGTTGSNKDGIFMVVVGGNLGVTNSQSWDQLAALYDGADSPSNFNHVTSAVDSTVAHSVSVICTCGANSDSITFYRMIVEFI